jgi:beta-lactamase regulating signal transducer with metallopeptidase domain
MSTGLAHAALAIASALFNSVWEGALIAGVVWLTLRCVPQLGAATRYAIWLCALAALVFVPIVTVSAPARPAVRAAEARLPAERNVVLGARMPAPVVAQGQVIVAKSAVAQAKVPAAATAAHKPRVTISPLVALTVAALWLLAAGVRVILLVLDFRALAAIRRGARWLSCAYEYPVYVSERVRVPIAAGFLKPAIVVPERLASELSPDAIETIVVHEVAHLRRYDVWTNALARVAEAILALNPVAWFIMRRLSTEREIACDDWVVARTGSGAAFANVLANLAGTVGRRAPLGAPSAFGSRHSVVVRIERLLDASPRELRLSVSAVASTVASLAVVALLLQTVAPVLAYDASRPVATRQPAAHGDWHCWSSDRPSRTIFIPPGQTVTDRGRGTKVLLLPAPAGGHFTTRDCGNSNSHVRVRVFAIPTGSGPFSTVAPAYPNGWSTQYPAACKVPSLVHAGVPAVPASLRTFVPNKTLTSSVRVDVDAAGTVTKAALVTASGMRAFDAAVLSAARQHTYPLTESSGFREVRPANAPSSWNAAHGSDTYSACTPLPRSYVWTGTFERRWMIVTAKPRPFVPARTNR